MRKATNLDEKDRMSFYYDEAKVHHIEALVRAERAAKRLKEQGFTSSFENIKKFFDSNYDNSIRHAEEVKILYDMLAMIFTRKDRSIIPYVPIGYFITIAQYWRNPYLGEMQAVSPQHQAHATSMVINFLIRLELIQILEVEIKLSEDNQSGQPATAKTQFIKLTTLGIAEVRERKPKLPIWYTTLAEIAEHKIAVMFGIIGFVASILGIYEFLREGIISSIKN